VLSGEEAQMRGRIQIHVAAAFLAWCVSACGNAPMAPTPMAAEPAVTALLLVQVDNLCAGRESDIRVFVDSVEIGMTNPGQSGVSRMVSVGQHALSAVSRRGTLWGPFPTNVSNDGRLERLGCMPPDAI
jgi:hypothetical protein